MMFDKRLFKLAKPVKVKFILSILFGIFTAFAIIAQAYFLSDIINKVFLKNFTFHNVQNIIYLLIILSLIRFLFQWLEQNFANKISTFVKQTLRRKITKHIFELGPDFTKSERSGEISNTLINGVEKLDAYFSQYLPQLFLSSLIPILILLFVVQIDLLSTIVFLVTAPLIPIFMVLIGNLADSINKKQWKNLSLMSAYFLDVIQGLYTVKIFGQTKRVLNKIELISKSFKKSTMKVLQIAFLSALVLEILSTISIAIIAVEIGLRLLYGTMEFHQALFILILAPEFYNPIRLLGVRYHAGMEGISAAERIFAILDTLQNNCITENAKFGLTNSEIIFEKVSFTYNDKNKPAIENLSFTIEPNKVTALVGESGSGKTTTINLLLKFISTQNGIIKIGNTDLNNIDRNNWLKNVSLISQTPYLFHDSIRYNLLASEENNKEAKIIEALKFAKIYNFVSELPQGLDTIIGERGTKLSGGEAQRIAIARAFLKNSPLLIMDEPTANLDPNTEYELLESLYKLIKNKTVIIIAHRLNTIEKADKILLFKEGKIVGEGSHSDLFKSNQYYKSMINKFKGAV